MLHVTCYTLHQTLVRMGAFDGMVSDIRTHLSDWCPAPGPGCLDTQSHLGPFPLSSHLLIKSPGGHLVQSYHSPWAMISVSGLHCIPPPSQSAGRNCLWGNSRSSNCKQIDVTLNLSFPIVFRGDVSIFIYYLSIGDSWIPRSEQISPYCSITPLVSLKMTKFLETWISHQINEFLCEALV